MPSSPRITGKKEELPEIVLEAKKWEKLAMCSEYRPYILYRKGESGFLIDLEELPKDSYKPIDGDYVFGFTFVDKLNDLLRYNVKLVRVLSDKQKDYEEREAARKNMVYHAKCPECYGFGDCSRCYGKGEISGTYKEMVSIAH